MEERRTISFSSEELASGRTTKEILQSVYEALDERGYNGIDQIAGYLMSGDSSYITSHKNARNQISMIDRDELAKQLVAAFLE